MSDTRSWSQVFLKLLLMFAVISVVGLAFYYLHQLKGVPGEGVTITFAILLVLPFCLGALVALLLGASGQRDSIIIVSPVILVFAMLLLGGIFVREGLICIAMLAVPWFFMALQGALMVWGLRGAEADHTKLNCGILIALPFLVLAGEGQITQQTSHYVVTRTIILEAAPEEIWPHLLDMREISSDEGRWNVTQDVLKVPRPLSALVVFKGGEVKRMARWSENISFEENIFEMVEFEALTWTFEFPNDSVQNRTDEHISPKGAHLNIHEGGYRLVELGDGRTRLTLFTTYEATTPMNWYARLWGELILGDIQANILGIIEGRAE